MFLCHQEDGRDFVEVLDSGISKVQGATSVVTQSRAVIGTPKYMAPEQAKGESNEGDARADQFAPAAMLYEMVTGISPFEADSVPSVLYKVVHHAPQRAHEVEPSLDEGLAAALTKGMAKDRDRRYSSIGAFVAALRGEPAPAEREVTPARAGSRAGDPPTPSAEALAATAGAPLDDLAVAPTALGNRPAQPTGSGTITDATGVEEESPSTRERGRLRTTALVLSGVVVAGAASWMLLDRSSDRAATAPAHGVDGGMTHAAAPVGPAEATSTVRIRFEVMPRADRLQVDGEELEGDTIELPRGARYQVRADKAGYATQTLYRVAEQSTTVPIRLDPIAPVAAEPAAAASRAGRDGKSGKPRAQRSSTGPASPPPDAQPAPAEKPGDGRFITDF